MNCNEYRKQRILAEGAGILAAEVRSHFAECAECQMYLRDEGSLRNEVRKLAESERAPQALQKNVAELLRRPRVQKQHGARRWLAVAATIVVMAGAAGRYLVYQHARTPSPERLTQEFIHDHLHYFPGSEQVVSSSPQQVQGWFQGRVEFPVHVPDVPGAVLEDARVCDISGHKAALLHYRRAPGDALISVFVAQEPKAFEQRKQPVALNTSIQGLNSTLWCHRGLVYDVVAALDDSALQQIAESVRQQAP